MTSPTPEKTLLNLEAVTNTVAAGNAVFIVENQEALERFIGLNLCATAHYSKRNNWTKLNTDVLIGARVYIVTDKADNEKTFGHLVATVLYGKAKSVYIISLPPTSTREQIIAICKSTLEWKPVELPKPEEFFYDKNQKEYLLKNKRKCWLSLSETQFKKELAHRGMRPHKEKGENLSEADEFIIQLRDERDVDYVGSLAGYNSGFYEIDGRRILVTDSPNIIKPVAGEWNNIGSLILNMLLDEKIKQKDYLFGWLKIAYESLASQKLRTGQTLVLCGKKDSGKSMLQKIITLIIGGRSAKPYQFMTDTTSFNSDMFKAEHLCIGDEQATTDIRSRRAFGAQVKQISGEDTQRCHPKHGEAIILTPFWRLTISLNDDPEELMVLPPISDSIEDKMIILRAVQAPMPMPSGTHDQRIAFWNQLVSEIPAFIDFLCQWQIPTELQSQRYGITHIQHPDLLQEIDALAPEYHLMMMLNKVLFPDNLSTTWRGTAEDLELKLTADANYTYESRKLLSWSNACGTYLSRLAKKYPERFTQERTAHKRIWSIEP